MKTSIGGGWNSICIKLYHNQCGGQVKSNGCASLIYGYAVVKLGVRIRLLYCDEANISCEYKTDWQTIESAHISANS